MKNGSRDVLHFTFQCLFWLSPAAALPHPEANTPTPRSSIQSILKSGNWTTGTVLSYPGQDTFFNATERWTVYEPPSYVGSVSVETEADVVKAVSFDLKSYVLMLLFNFCLNNNYIRFDWQDQTVCRFWPRAAAMVTTPTSETSRMA